MGGSSPQLTPPFSLLKERRLASWFAANEAEKVGLSDAAQLAFAISQNRAIFTFNRGDFVQLHTEFLHQNRTHSGIIVSDQLEIGVVIRRLLKLLDARSTEDMRNWLEFLSNWR